MVNLTRVGMFLSVLLLSACQTLPNEQVAVEKNSPKPSSTPSKKATQAPKVDSVVTGSTITDNLLQQANMQQQAGDHQLAITTLERAIRIAPRYPKSYYRLAELHYQQGNYTQALSLAQKAISLGASGKLRRQSLTLIANSSH